MPYKVKQEELDAIRLRAARGIFPGWAPQFIKTWNPRMDTPQHKHLAEAALERGFPVATSTRMSRDELVGWLSENPLHEEPSSAQCANSTGKFYLIKALDE